MTLYKKPIGPGRLTLTDADGLATDFSCQLTSTTVAWSDDTGDPVDVLCGEEEPGDTTWSATISGTMYQDRRLQGLVAWTWAHKGEKFDSVFVGNNDDGTQVTGKVTVKPLDFGGDVKASPTSDFEWAYVGEPSMVALTEPAVHVDPANPVEADVIDSPAPVA